MKKNRKRIKLTVLVGCALSLFLAGCKDRNYKVISNGEVSVELMRLPDADRSEGSGYRFRVLPSKVFTGTHLLNTENFWYHMDSCFYTEKKGVKTYVALVQPVANGTQNNFEYLLQFDPAITSQQDSVRLVYDDRYISRLHYTFNIKL